MRIRERFNPRAPCGARRMRVGEVRGARFISTHAPLAGRDCTDTNSFPSAIISTHAPLAGRDANALGVEQNSIISTHAPLAGRDGLRLKRFM